MQNQEYYDLEVLVESHVNNIYPDRPGKQIAQALIKAMDLNNCQCIPVPHSNHWTEKDVWVISYGDSIQQDNEKPLKTLLDFLERDLKGLINGIHILPFYPYSSDDGFSVIDYRKVNEALGDWDDIEHIASHYRLMADLVINHCSTRGQWFENFKYNKHPGKDYFITADKDSDLSAVVRPRTSPLLKTVETLDGQKHVWCTFSHDQADLNFANPDVLVEMAKIIKYYLDWGVRIFRLDAVAFLWKEQGTNCIHLPQTHEIIRLLHTLIEHCCPEAILITETNVPNHENLSYFGNANEAHGVYNFALPPLILHALITGTSKHLKAWQMSMPPAQTGTFYFNFLASHDGIGLRPVEGLLTENEISQLVKTMESFGGKISWRSIGNHQPKPYEINIALFDAFKGSLSGIDNWQLQRFLCAHAIMLSLEGIPGLYIHSIIGTENYEKGVIHTNNNRSINRYKWNIDELEEKLNDLNSHHTAVYKGIRKLLEIRTKQPAFHPNAVQYTLHINDQVFGFWRQSPNREQSIFCLHNVSDAAVTIPLSSLNLINLDTWTNLITGTLFTDLEHTITLAPYEFIWLTNKAT